jgi:hypothetical protein
VLSPLGANLVKQMEQGKEEQENGTEDEFSDNSDTDHEELGIVN